MKASQLNASTWSKGHGAFTLLELLVVLSITIVLLGMAVPAIQSLKNASDLTNAAYTIQGALEQARTYAIANNTYTWVGLFEEDNSQQPQTPAQSGTGRVVLCSVASADGTCIYSKTTAEASNPSAQTLLSSRLVQISKPIRINNVHVFDATAEAIGKRPAGIVNNQSLVGLTSQPRLFSFSYPISGTPSYTFGTSTANANGVIQFDPQGEAISDAGPITIPATSLEIAIEEAHGAQVGTSPNIIAIDASGLTGQVTIYRP